MKTKRTHDRNASAETKLLLAARRLFCREGIHATGVARLVREAKVARRTLYERYGSKENLLRAVFANEAQMWHRWFDDDLSRHNEDPYGRLLSLFDLLHDWFSSGTFFGCIFVNAVAEHAKKGGWVQAMAISHRASINHRIAALLREAGVADPRLVTEKLSLVIDGAMVTAMVTGDAEEARIARAAAADLLAAAGIVPRRTRALRSSTARGR
jgi:AcrR family transcriptional regulator